MFKKIFGLFVALTIVFSSISLVSASNNSQEDVLLTTIENSLTNDDREHFASLSLEKKQEIIDILQDKEAIMELMENLEFSIESEGIKEIGNFVVVTEVDNSFVAQPLVQTRSSSSSWRHTGEWYAKYGVSHTASIHGVNILKITSWIEYVSDRKEIKRILWYNIIQAESFIPLWNLHFSSQRAYILGSEAVFESDFSYRFSFRDWGITAASGYIGVAGDIHGNGRSWAGKY